MAEKSRQIGPYCRPATLAKIDGRTKEAAIMRRVRAELTAFVGPNPTVIKQRLIDRAVILSLRVAQLDAKIIVGGAMTTHDANYALAWNNALRRTLVALGVPTELPPRRRSDGDPFAALRDHVAAQGNEAA